MKRFAPNYYKDFRCIADKCRHSCCIGWEIDVDEDTLAYYDGVEGEMGERLKQNIHRDVDNACFRLCRDERCPFLNKSGLCDIILTLGEEHISEICTEHPRFYNFIADRQEAGLGLCCEEAARLILTQKDKTSLTLLGDDGDAEECSAFEGELLELRERLFDILQHEGDTETKAQAMLLAAGAEKSERTISEWADIFLSLERMDPAWTEALLTLRGEKAPCPALGKAYEKLLLYFLYRHLAAAEDEEDASARVLFAYLGYSVIRALCEARAASAGKCAEEDMCELARLYSAEIEYSEENTAALLRILRKE